MKLSSDEILFRPFCLDDASTLISWAPTSDDLLQWAGPLFTFPLEEEQLAKYASTADDCRHLISAVIRDSNAVVGHAELNILADHELGQIRRLAVAPAMRERGVATRLLQWLVTFAFDDLGLHRLELCVFSFNERALRCYERAGFRREGLARDARKASNGYWDLVYMALLENWYRTDKARSCEHQIDDRGKMK